MMLDNLYSSMDGSTYKNPIYYEYVQGGVNLSVFNALIVILLLVLRVHYDTIYFGKSGYT